MELIEMEELGKIVDEIGIEAVVQQIDEFFLYREEQYKEKALRQKDYVLAEQKALRNRGKNLQNA